MAHRLLVEEKEVNNDGNISSSILWECLLHERKSPSNVSSRLPARFATRQTRPESRRKCPNISPDWFPLHWPPCIVIHWVCAVSMSGLRYWLGFYELLMAARLHPLTWRIWLLLFVSAHSHCNRGQSDRDRLASLPSPIRTLSERRKNASVASFEPRRIGLYFAVVKTHSCRFAFREKPGRKSWGELRLLSFASRCLVSYANTVSHYSKAQIVRGFLKTVSSGDFREKFTACADFESVFIFLLFAGFFRARIRTRTLCPGLHIDRLRNALQWL